MKLICDEIFGESNFISQMPRKTVSHIRKTSYNELQNLHDYVLLYAVNKEKVVLNKKNAGQKLISKRWKR